MSIKDQATPGITRPFDEPDPWDVAPGYRVFDREVALGNGTALRIFRYSDFDGPTYIGVRPSGGQIKGGFMVVHKGEHISPAQAREAFGIPDHLNDGHNMADICNTYSGTLKERVGTYCPNLCVGHRKIPCRECKFVFHRKEIEGNKGICNECAGRYFCGNCEAEIPEGTRLCEDCQKAVDREAARLDEGDRKCHEYMEGE